MNRLEVRGHLRAGFRRHVHTGHRLATVQQFAQAILDRLLCGGKAAFRGFLRRLHQVSVGIHGLQQATQWRSGRSEYSQCLRGAGDGRKGLHLDVIQQ